ncbi:hypothetical protein [Salinimonas marina]
MTTIGTPFTAGATRIMLLGGGEPGKKVAIEKARKVVIVVGVRL